MSFYAQAWVRAGIGFLGSLSIGVLVMIGILPDPALFVMILFLFVFLFGVMGILIGRKERKLQNRD